MRLHIYMLCRMLVAMPAEIAVLEVIAEPTRRRILDAVRERRAVGRRAGRAGRDASAGCVAPPQGAARRRAGGGPAGRPAAAVPAATRAADGARRVAGAVSSGVGRRGSTRSSGTCDAPPHRSPREQRNTDERPHRFLLRRHVGAHRRWRRHPLRTPPALPDPRRLGRDHEPGAAGGLVAAVRRRHHRRPPRGRRDGVRRPW